jgi:hypothetical protein
MKISVRTMLLVAACAVLAACGGAGGQAPTPEEQSGVVTQQYPAPGVAESEGYPAPGAPPAAPTLEPTAPPAAQAAPTTAPMGLVGPEWTIAFSGDLNRDGRPDVVAYKPGSPPPGPTFRQPSYASYRGSASEAVIVQADDAGRPQVLVAMSLDGITIGGRGVGGFSGGPSAFMISVSAGEPPLVSALPINASGEPYTQPAAVRWNAAARTWELLPGTSK